jgi:hypothetical protein
LPEGAGDGGLRLLVGGIVGAEGQGRLAVVIAALLAGTGATTATQAKEETMTIRYRLLIVALAASAFSCSNSEAELVQFVDGQFEVLKPANWSLIPNADTDAVLVMGNRREQVYCQVFTEPKEDFTPGFTVEDYSDGTRALLAARADVASETGPEKLVLSGQSAVRYEMIATFDNMRFKCWHVCIESPAHFHQVLAWTRPPKFESQKSTFQAILDSIR